MHRPPSLATVRRDLGDDRLEPGVTLERGEQRHGCHPEQDGIPLFVRLLEGVESPVDVADRCVEQDEGFLRDEALRLAERAVRL